MKQDIRIVQLRNYFDFNRNTMDGRNGSSTYRAFSCFDEVTVYPMWNEEERKFGDPISTLSDAYFAIQNMFHKNEKTEYRSQQLIMAFTDVKGIKEQQTIDQFWKTLKHAAIFFVTMVNVSLYTTLEKTVEKINRIYTGKEYLVYYSFEYNEILIFCKSNSFRDYISLVAQLNYPEGEGEKSSILDTLTICGFQENSAEIEDETFDANLCLGITDYQKFEEYIGIVKEKTKLTNDDVACRWMLGRNDISVLFRGITLKKLYVVYKAYMEQLPWVSTLDMSIMVDHDLGLKLNGSTALELNADSGTLKMYENLKTCFCKEKEQLESKYAECCAKMGIKTDLVFIRLLYDLERMVTNILTVQLARDLAICLISQFRDTIQYLRKTCEIISNDPKTRENGELKSQLESTINFIYLNITTLINSTVHSDRQFIQIPPCGVTAFEMPPKIMTYYSIMAHKIVSIFSESDDVFYGIMLSPKLVDGLEVETMPVAETSEPHHMISINISEKNMYEPRRTALILGHELAHFVGNTTRLRTKRRELILAHYINKLLKDLLISYGSILFCPQEELNAYVMQIDTFEFAKELAKKHCPEAKKEYDLDARRKCIWENILELPQQIVENEKVFQEIVNTFVFPANKSPVFENCLIRHISSRLTAFPITGSDSGFDQAPTFDSRFLQKHGESLFVASSKKYIKEWEQDGVQKTYLDYVQATDYLFYEAYADVGMILIYNITPNDYVTLFLSGRQDDEIELARFRAVACAMQKTEVWTEKDVCSKNEEITCCSCERWKQALFKTLISSLSEDTPYEYYNLISELKFELDYPLQSLLIEYLVACIHALKEQFNKPEKRAQIKELREIFESVYPDASAYEAVVRIRKMEEDQLRHWE